MAKKKSYTRDLMFLGDNPASSVRRGQEIDRIGALQRLIEERTRGTAPTVANAERLPQDPRMESFYRAYFDNVPQAVMTESPSRAAGIARSALSGAGSFGGWAGPMVDEPMPEAAARFAGELVSDPLNAVGLGALKVLGRGVKKVLPAAVGVGGSAYAADADAAATPGRRLMHLINSEGFKDLRPAREFYWPHRGTEPVGSTAFDDPRVASRLLVDVPGANLVPVHRRSTRAGLFNLIDENGNLRVDDVDGVRTGFAGGGSAIRKGLEKFGRRAARGEFDETAEAPMGALSVVKPKGGNWLAGSVEDALKGLKTPISPTLREDMARTGYPVNEEALASINQLNSWIEGPLTKYVKTRMASPEDELLRLADEEDLLHFNPPASTPEASWITGRIPTGESEMAIAWDQIADVGVGSGVPAKRILQREGVLDANPWLAKLAPDALVYSGHELSTEKVGFNHLIDELSNALRPDSDLPRNLRLTPEAVRNMSMEKAVRRVADINAWRETQKAETNRALAEKASLVREYPHSETMPNPKGLRWVELKQRDGASLSDEQLAKAMEERGMFPDEIKSALEDPAQRKQIEEMAFEDTGELAAQLKYEGDTMGHCVGGYCEDVLEGRTRIFSLRDAKGEPHVTVEVNPGKERVNPQDEDMVAPAVPSIVQIKGKHNRAPNEEYLPFVQDFVRNNPLGGSWAGVGDLQNAGMRRFLDAFNSNELKKIQEAGIEVPYYATPQEIQEIGNKVWPGQYGTAPGMAQGGPVIQSSPADTARATITASWETLFPQGAM